MFEDFNPQRQKPIRALQKAEPTINFIHAFIFLPIIGFCSIILSHNVPELKKDSIDVKYHVNSYRPYDGLINLSNFNKINEKIEFEIKENITIEENTMLDGLTTPFRNNVGTSLIPINISKFQLQNIINTYVNSDGYIYNDRIGYYKQCECSENLCLNPLISSKVKYFSNYTNVIALTSDIENETSWIMNFLPFLFMIPKSVLKSSSILVKQSYHSVSFALEFLNVSTDKIITLKNDEMIFAKNLYFFSPPNCESINLNSLKFLRAKICKILDLDKKSPMKHFINLKEQFNESDTDKFDITLLLNAKYGFHYWEKYYPERNFARQVKRFNKCSVFVSISCNTLSWVLFMQKNTIVLEIQSISSLINYKLLSLVNNVNYCVVSLGKSVNVHDPREIYFYWERIVRESFIL